MPRRHWRRGIACFWATLTASMLLAATGSHAASEISPTTQATASNAGWLAYAPAPAVAGAVCLVDTGVNLNSDTQSAVTARTALDGGVPDDVDHDAHHGTRMAMIMAAARNGTGMVGAWPALRVVSVRAAAPPPAGQEPAFYYTAYDRAIRTCTDLSTPAAPIMAVELAVGSREAPSQTEADTMAEYVALAHADNVSVIAAAGNEGGPVSAPASLPGVVGVAAGDQHGVLCEGSSRGVGVDVIGPGCDLDSVDPVTLAPEAGWWGTSQASAFTAAVLTALRSYKPTLTWAQGEQLLTSTTKAGMLDVAAAFRAAGLGSVVDAGLRAMPKPPPPPVKAWAAPKVRSASYRRGVLRVRLASTPKGARVKLDVFWRVRGGRARKAKTLYTTMTTIQTHLAKRPVKLALAFRDAKVKQHDSKTTAVRISR